MFMDLIPSLSLSIAHSKTKNGYVRSNHQFFSNNKSISDFALSYCAGGDLLSTLKRVSSFDEKVTRFYSAEVCEHMLCSFLCLPPPLSLNLSHLSRCVMCSFEPATLWGKENRG